MKSSQPHKITRSRVIVGLMVTAMLASCAAPAANRGSMVPETAPERATVPPVVPTMTVPTKPTKANAAVGAAKTEQEDIRFTDVASCKVETERLNAEYKILKDAFDAGTPTGSVPIKPTLKPGECEAFIASAKQEYAAQAPTYSKQGDCEVSGRSCERVEPSPSNNNVEPIYRPVFVGSYGYNPWAPPIYIGGRRDYGQQTVIIERDSGNSASSGSRATGSSNGTSSSTFRPAPSKTTSKTTSTTSKPGYSSTTPSKPSSASGSGAVSGRGSSGFGSSYGYSGTGGK